METLHHVFASFEIFSSIFNAFPSIFNPLIHGFQTLFILLFNSLKHIVSLNPGVISGTIFISLAYFLGSAVSRLRKIRA